MQLIGMLDSPYVRRVAVALQFMGLPFEHQSVSVFRGFAQFQKINPVVKAPTLVCDDGTVLMDSTLILQYAQALPGARRALLPSGGPALAQALRLNGLALAACEKSVQIVYEHMIRPPEKWHQPWLERVTSQALAAYDELEAELKRHPLTLSRESIDLAGLTIAVNWYFTVQMVPQEVPPARYPLLNALSAQAEALPEFQAAPHSDAVYPVRKESA